MADIDSANNGNGESGGKLPKGPGNLPLAPKAKLWLWGILLLVILIGAVGGQIITLYTDWLWFNEIKFQSVFLTMWKTKLLLGAITAVVCFIALASSIFIANILSPKDLLFIDNLIEIPNRDAVEPYINKFLVIAALIISIGAGIIFSAQWKQALMYLNASKFDMADPVFKKDLGFFVFNLPFLGQLYKLAFMILILGIIASLVTYALHRGVRITSRGLFISPGPAAHLSILAGLLFLLKAAGYKLSVFGLVVHPWNITRMPLFGAGYTDLNARLPVLNVLLYVSLVVALLFFINSIFKGWKIPAAGIALLVLVSLFGGSVYPSIVQKFRVEPNEKEMESAYIQTHISQTHLGYKLRDGIDIEEYENIKINPNLTYSQLADNKLTLGNIRLWDNRPLLDTYKQKQSLRPYYQFNDVDIDRYTIKDPDTGQEVYEQVMLSARELNYDQLPSKSWINLHLTYTHGWGLVMSPVNKFTCVPNPKPEEECEGLPEFYLKDIPLDKSGVFNVNRPEIYYGELTTDYVFVKTKTPEFDYPVGNQNKESTYEGTGGIPMGGFFRRLAFAIKFRTVNILLNTDITSESRLMFRRKLWERAYAAFPMLDYDSDPYLVVGEDGRLYWILDAYATTQYLPYSIPFNALPYLPRDYQYPAWNYIRNSVKVVIDAYNGSMEYYLADDLDPVARTYAKIFPAVFKPMSAMPKFIKSHIRYPKGLFAYQSWVYLSYQMDSPRTFYDQEDRWEVAKEQFYSEKQTVDPYYIIMRLPGHEKEEFLLMIPFTPMGKPNLSAWLAARSDYSDDVTRNEYGKLLVYKFEKSSQILGTEQVEALISQDPDFSEKMTLWGQKGSEVIRGNMLVIPVEDSILYVEPIYIQSEQTKYPSIRRVAVGFKFGDKDKVVIRRTLEEALAEMFMTPEEQNLAAGLSETPISIPTGVTTQTAPVNVPVPGSLADLIKSANNQFENAVEKQRKGDWAGYGHDLDRLRNTLKQLMENSGVQGTEPQAPETKPATPDVAPVNQ